MDTNLIAGLIAGGIIIFQDVRIGIQEKVIGSILSEQMRFLTALEKKGVLTIEDMTKINKLQVESFILRATEANKTETGK